MSKMRILIADDEEGIRESVSLILGPDYAVEAVADGEAAMAKLERGRFDLALLDIKMPKLDGVEIMRRIKSQRLEVPVLVLTAYQSVELAKEAVKLGALDYIPKPFDRDHLLEVVHSILAKR